MSVARVDVADYLAQEAVAETKHEFVNGEIVAMAGASLEHEAVKVGLSTALVRALALAGKPCITLGSDTRVRIDETGLYGYPDATVVCGRPDLDRTHAPPTLLNPQVVFEVLSASTEAYDRGAKAGHYRQRASLMEYVLVSSTERSVEVLRRDEGAGGSRLIPGARRLSEAAWPVAVGWVAYLGASRRGITSAQLASTSA